MRFEFAEDNDVHLALVKFLCSQITNKTLRTLRYTSAVSAINL